MNNDELREAIKEKESKLWRMLKNIFYCGSSSGYSTYEDIKQFVEQETKLLNKFIEQNEELEDEI